MDMDVFAANSAAILPKSPCCHITKLTFARNQLYDGRSAIRPASFAMAMAGTSHGSRRLMGGSTGELVESTSSNLRINLQDVAHRM